MNSKELLKHIDNQNIKAVNAIIDIIINDDYCQEILGIEIGNKAKVQFKKEMSLFLSIPNSKDKIDALMDYLLGDYGLEEFALAEQYVSANMYTFSSSLHVFKFSEFYHCYFYSSDGNYKAVTVDPTEFCYDAAGSMIAYQEQEAENLKDEYWKNIDTTNSVDFKFKFTFD